MNTYFSMSTCRSSCSIRVCSARYMLDVGSDIDVDADWPYARVRLLPGPFTWFERYVNQGWFDWAHLTEILLLDPSGPVPCDACQNWDTSYSLLPEYSRLPYPCPIVCSLLLKLKGVMAEKWREEMFSGWGRFVFETVFVHVLTTSCGLLRRRPITWIRYIIFR